MVHTQQLEVVQSASLGTHASTAFPLKPTEVPVTAPRALLTSLCLTLHIILSLKSEKLLLEL